MLGKIKNLLRSGNNPLQQVARRLLELSKCNMQHTDTISWKPTLNKKTEEVHFVSNCKGVYHQLLYKNMCLRTNLSNQWVYTKTSKILKILNFSKINDEVVMFAAELRNLNDFYVNPIKSSTLYIFTSDLIEEPPAIYKLSEIRCKMFYINNPIAKHTFFPILHTIIAE